MDGVASPPTWSPLALSRTSWTRSSSFFGATTTPSNSSSTSTTVCSRSPVPYRDVNLTHHTRTCGINETGGLAAVRRLDSCFPSLFQRLLSLFRQLLSSLALSLFNTSGCPLLFLGSSVVWFGSLAHPVTLFLLSGGPTTYRSAQRKDEFIQRYLHLSVDLLSIPPLEFPCDPVTLWPEPD
jgi:hypothetical protein